MTRWTAGALTLVTLALVATIVGVSHLIRRDRAALVDRYARENLRELDEAVREIEEDLDDVGEDLRFAGQLVQAADNPADRRRELTALLAVVKQYRQASVFDHDGLKLISVLDPLERRRGAPDAFDRVMARAATEALERPGEIVVSPRLAPDARGWYRVFATALPSQAAGRGAISILVDTEPFFSRLRLVSSSPSRRLLLLGAHGAGMPASDGLLAARVEALDRPGKVPRAFARLVRRMRAGARGTVALPEPEARKLGLGRAEAIATHCPIRMAAGGLWSVATVGSTLQLRSHEQAIVMRLGLASGAIALSLVALGGYLVVVSRRSAAMRERLKHAEEVARLHERNAIAESQLLRAEKLATVGVLAAGIAHEIGTPLGVVRGRAEYVRSKLGHDHPQSDGIRVIIEQIDAVTRTIRQLLDFSRVRPAAVRPVAIGPVARSVAELLHFEASRRKVSIAVGECDGESVAADPDQMQQVLVNLVMNALDACGPGGRVTMSAWGGSDGAVCLVVADDGCGIERESLNQVFDPFYTTKKRGQGTGLGLTIAAQIVRNHGGQIELESEPGHGTRVTLLWPAARAAREVRDEARA